MQITAKKKGQIIPNHAKEGKCASVHLNIPFKLLKQILNSLLQVSFQSYDNVCSSS
jgi:hypothetical protein